MGFYSKFMKCPICYHLDTKVVDSRVAQDGLSIRRRRECLKCGFRFSTYEEIELLDLIIVKRDGRREAYNREKMVNGLKKSCEKRPITDDRFKRLIHSIERDLQRFKKTEITSKQVGQTVMKNLKKVDSIDICEGLEIKCILKTTAFPDSFWSGLVVI